jgi:hypothetical protein
VFTDEFEPNIRMRVTVAGPGLALSGEATRITHEPYEGRSIVFEEGRATGRLMGQGVSLSFEAVHRWDNPGGFVMAEYLVNADLAGIFERPLHTRVTRSGDYLLLNFRNAPEGTPSTRPFPLPEGADLSSDLMSPARIRPVFVGARWQLQTVGLSGEIRSAGVEVVEEAEAEFGGTTRTAYRAVVRVETATGSFRELEVWYDREGRALRQTVWIGPFEAVFERLERFVPDEEAIARLLARDRAADAPARAEEAP